MHPMFQAGRVGQARLGLAEKVVKGVVRPR